MYALIHMLAGRQLLVEQLLALAAALLIAEFFYKFHSFTLECLAFLATWYAIGAVVKGLTVISQRVTGRR
jgi:hypothetical protein